MSSKRKCIKPGCLNDALPGEPYCATDRFVGTPGTGAATPNDPPIIITGGSVRLYFDPGTLTGSGGKYSNAGKKIKRVTIEKGGATIFDQDVPDGLITVMVAYGD
jgi:hypothetical protein